MEISEKNFEATIETALLSGGPDAEGEVGEASHRLEELGGMTSKVQPASQVECTFL